ncbi:MAG: hypothetical protein R3F23_07215 [Verrucomicrobiia bacterium]
MSAKKSILIIENDSRLSRGLRDHLEKTFHETRVEIAGSAAKAKHICQMFPPNFILWDGTPNEHGSQEEYEQCIPENLWSRVIPISENETHLTFAKNKGSHAPIPKQNHAIHAWVDQVTHYLNPLVNHSKGKSKS